MATRVSAAHENQNVESLQKACQRLRPVCFSYYFIFFFFFFVSAFCIFLARCVSFACSPRSRQEQMRQSFIKINKT